MSTGLKYTVTSSSCSHNYACCCNRRMHNLAVHAFLKNPPDVFPALNGILAGLAAITGPCPVVEPRAAAFIGFVGGFVYYGSSTLLKKLQIDDPLDAAPVHFFCGIWGVLSAGLFAEKSYTSSVYGKMRIPMVLSWVVVESNSETKSSVYLQLLVGYVSHALLFSEA